MQSIEVAQMKAMMETMMRMMTKVTMDVDELKKGLEEVKQDVRSLRVQFNDQFNPPVIQERLTAVDVQRSGIILSH